MLPINDIKQEIAPLFSPAIGEFRLKTYFSYYAIFKNDLMIALYQDNAIYLRIAAEYIDKISQNPESYCLSDPKIGIQSKKFYLIPNSILSNTSFFHQLLYAVIAELKQEKQERNQKRATQIRTLPNMNLKLERMLKKVGIHSIQEFTDIGYISAFIRLIMYGFDATEELLFKLSGAITHQYIYTFTEQQKEELLKEANQALYIAGLRNRF